MKRNNKLLIIILFLLILPINVNAKENLVNIYLFHSDGCSHCKSEIKLLDYLERQYSNIKVYKYEIHENRNEEILTQVALLYKIKNNAVPLTIIGDKALIGYNENKTKLSFIKTIDYYSKYGYIDKTASIVGNKDLPQYKVEDNQISINKFLKVYGNYNIIGDINTKDIDVETTTILTSILTELNIFTIVITIISVVIALKRPSYKDKITTISIYTLSYLVCNTILLLNTKSISYIMYILYIILIVYLLIKYKLDSNNSNINIIIIILLSIASNILKYSLINKYIKIYLETIRLNKLSVFETILQYLINTTIVSLILFVLILFINSLKKIIKRSN